MKASLKVYRVFALFAALGVLLTASTASAIKIWENEEDDQYFDVSIYTQPFFQWTQVPCLPADTEGDGNYSCTGERNTFNGFSLQRTRLVFRGAANEYVDFKVELQTIPQTQALEAQLNIHLLEGLTWRIGRYRVPYSQQELTSESRLQMDRADLIRVTPGRQLGTSLRLNLGDLIDTLPENFIIVEGGVFNGESAKARLPIAPIDEFFLFGGRFEINPFGLPGNRRFESDIRPPSERHEPWLSIGAQFATNESGPEDYTEDTFGADLSFKLHGFSFYTEFMRRNRNFASTEAGIDQYAQGWNVQMGYMIPHPMLREHLEVAARVEQYDPQHAARIEDSAAIRPPTAGGAALVEDSSRAQSTRNYIGTINYFFTGHDFKLSLIYTHRVAQEEYFRSKDDPNVPLDDDDDSFFVRLTYRF